MPFTSRQDELHIHLLGGFQVALGARRINDSEWYLRTVRNLIKLLALALDHRMHRGELMDLLWLELEPEAASKTLHKALDVARRVLEPELPATRPSACLHLTGEVVSLATPGPLWIDVEEFRTAVQRAQSTQDPADSHAALRLCAGDLLPEDRAEDWAMRQREQLQAARETLLLAQLQEQQGEVEAAIAMLQRAKQCSTTTQ